MLKKLIYLIAILAFTVFSILKVNAQQFIEINAGTFDDLADGCMDVGDIDNDGDVDLVTSEVNYIKIYTQGSDGIFSKINTIPSIGTGNHYPKVILKDIDNDNILDMIIGKDTETYLYIGNGAGNFHYRIGLPRSEERALKVADFNLDGYNDILIANNIGNSGVYLNTGNSSLFNYLPSWSIPDSSFSGTGVGYIGTDNYPDIVLTSSGFTKVFLNNTGTDLVEATGINLAYAQYGRAVITNINDDGYNDIIIVGSNSISGSEIYTNDGSGNFNIKNPDSIVGVKHCDIISCDIDNDNDQDIIIMGLNDDYFDPGGTFNPSTKIYETWY